MDPRPGANDLEKRKVFFLFTRIRIPNRPIRNLVIMQTELFWLIIIIIIIIIIAAAWLLSLLDTMDASLSGHGQCGGVEGGEVINVFTGEQQKELRGREGAVGKTDDFLYAPVTNSFSCLFLFL